MGRSLDMIEPGAPALPGAWLCSCGFADETIADPGRCRRPHDVVLRDALSRFSITTWPEDIRTHVSRGFHQYPAGYFRPFPIMPIWAAMEEAGFAAARDVDYGGTIAASVAREIADKLERWLQDRRAALVSVDRVADEIAALRRDSFFVDYPDHLVRDLLGDRDRAFDDLRWFAWFAAYNRLAAAHGGYTVG